MGINAHISASLQSIRKSSPGHTLCYSIGSDSVNHAVGLPVAVPFTIFDHTVSRILSCKKYKCSHNSPIFHAYIGNSCFYIIFYRGNFRVAVLPLVWITVVFHKFPGNFI